MAWPTTSTNTTAGYSASGITTIRWGTRGVLTKIGSQSLGSNPTSVGIVTRFNQKQIVDNSKMSNGDGLTVTRVQIIDGAQWDVTVRDDTTITQRPVVGATCVIVDGMGYIGSVGATDDAVVVEASYDIAPKQAGEFSLTLENLRLIESQSAR